MSKDTSQAVREGEMIVVENGATLPPRCVCCNDEASGAPRKFEYTWNPRGLKMGRSPVAIAAVLTNRRGFVRAFYCAKHRPNRARRVAITLAIVAVGAIIAIIGMSRDMPNLGTTGIVLSALALAIGGAALVMPPPWLKCEQIDESGRLYLKPMSQRYLDSFPTA